MVKLDHSRIIEPEHYPVDNWKTLIDKADALCGGQNQLADRLGCDRSNFSKARRSARGLNDDQIKRLAALLGMSAADVWLIAQDARNPFKVSASGVLAIVAAVMLSGPHSAAEAYAARASGESGSGAGIHIVRHWRRVLRGVRRLLPWTRQAA